MSATERKFQVFLCHALQDQPVVRELYQLLLAEGWIDPWLNEEKLPSMLQIGGYNVQFRKICFRSNLRLNMGRY